MVTPRSILLAGLIFILAFSIRIAVTARFVALSSAPDQEAGGLDIVDYEEFDWSFVSGKWCALTDGQLTARRTPGASFAIAIPYLAFGRSHSILLDQMSAPPSNTLLPRVCQHALEAGQPRSKAWHAYPSR